MKKRGQVWIETVVYTLIAFVILGAVLSFAKPKIEKLQDQSVIEQSIKIMEDIDSVIEEIKSVPGNKREIEIGIKKGSFTIDAENNKIIFNIDSRLTYSEPGEEFKKGDIAILNNQIGENNKISATMDYESKYDIQWNGGDQLKLLVKSSTPYRLFVSNNGGSPTTINFEFA